MYVPNEMVRQTRLFTCWPSDGELWQDNLEPARDEFAAFLRLVMQPDDTGHGLPVTVLAANDETEASVRSAMGNSVSVLRAPYGDVWARDTGPVFGWRDGKLIAASFRFNGWGGKYELPGDETVARSIAKAAGATLRPTDMIAEGGALEFDGRGTVLTTRQCLLNANRNPDLSEAEVTSRLKEALGVEKVLWLDDGLLHDHTDGHIDNVARFIAPGVIVCQKASGTDDPQADVLDACTDQLARMSDARGQPLKVIRIPSPGRITDLDGEIRPASHMNWAVGPRNIVLPTYGTASGDEAVRVLQRHISNREVIASPSSHILSGGGSFHCVTCHVPEGRA